MDRLSYSLQRRRRPDQTRRPWWPWVVVGVVVLGLGLGLAPWSGREAQRSLRVIFTGETQGRITACMCDGYLAGGFAYREGFLARQQDPYLLVDIGVMGNGQDEAAHIWTREVARGMVAMGYDAINAGQSEVAGGHGHLLRLAALAPMLVSASVVTPDGQPVLPPFVVSERGGFPVAITGLVDPDRPHGRGLRSRPPAEALAAALPAMREAADAIIVLADLDRLAADALAADFPEVALLLHRSRNDTRLPEGLGRSHLGAIYGSRYLADCRLEWRGRRIEARSTAIELTEEWVDQRVELTPPEGITTSPSILDFGRLGDGQRRQAILTLHNHNAEAVRVERVFSTCSCFAMDVGRPHIAAGDTATITVDLHAVDLAGANRFPIYIQISGAVEGLLTVQAIATITDNEDQP